jgi:hypothetical protein
VRYAALISNTSERGSYKLDCSIIYEEESIDMTDTIRSIVTSPGLLFKLRNKCFNRCKVSESISLILKVLIIDFLEGYKRLGV